jgi:hypothetical protein
LVLENEPWKKGGETISNLPEGKIHTIEFKDVGNWIKPDNQSVVLEGGQTITINGTY